MRETDPTTRPTRVQALQPFASRDAERDDENFPCDVECTPEPLVVDAQGAYVSPEAVDCHHVCEEGLGVVARRELAGELLEESEDVLARRIVAVERVGCWARQERRKQVVDAFCVEES